MIKIKDQTVSANKLCKMYQNNKTPICVVLNSAKDVELFANELSLYTNMEKISIFPDSEILPYDHISSPERIITKRFNVINKKSEIKFLITNIKSLFEKYPPLTFFKSFNTFKLDQIISMKDFIDILTSLGYIRLDKTFQINQYSVRGGIIDVFIPLYENPLRIEFFDDVIESIRFFDKDSQLSLKEIDEFNLTNGSITPNNNPDINIFKDNWRNYFQDYDERYCSLFNQIIEGNKNLEGVEIYNNLFFENTVSFFSIFNQFKFIGDINCFEHIDNYQKYIWERYTEESIDLTRPLIKPTDNYLDIDSIKEKINLDESLYIDLLNIDINKIDDHLPKYDHIIICTNNSLNIEKYKKDYPDLKRINSIDDQLEKINIYHSKPFNSHIYNNILLIHDNEEWVNDLDVIKHENYSFFDTPIFLEDDVVVHEKYGIGIYKGLEIVTTDSTSNEYLKLSYKDNENLYVPLRSINLLSKYHKSISSINLELDSLSSKKWLKKKDKADKIVKDHAAEILNIESKRINSNAKSMTISKDVEKIFSHTFPYKETIDQLKAINDISKDLSLIKPMNRLLCGDVGFGKTEVALRGAHIAVENSSQVIILTPSTILCDQHYETTKKRFIDYPFNIKKLNRRTPLKDKNKIINDYNLKKIDILICTHIIFNQVINFEDTGLLIIDEEHRFGTNQKNIIKQHQENIHILYLSATPIPRTMNFIFSGLKDFSFLSTPPSSRLSIKSNKLIENDQIIKEAIERELNRNGQTFIVQNNISKIESLVRRIQTLIPDIKIGIAHGKLSNKDISSIMTNFANGSIDVLVCTTIVEMGLDIPNANTMIVIDSQNFGLAQLHQLRGRVGRSNKQGYAYFLIPDIKLNKDASYRLDSIIRHSKLGSGYFLAQEDLEIRGAGEILGDKQSGHVDSIGLTLYLSMLKEAINGKNSINVFRSNINFYDSAYIPSDYLPSTVERLKIYKIIDEAKTFDNLVKARLNLEDRCGKLPQEVQNLFKNEEIKIKCKVLKFSKLMSTSKQTKITIDLPIESTIQTKLINLITKNTSLFILNNNELIYKLNENDPSMRRSKITKFLDDLL